nr:AMP-binding protein [Fodinicola feengrottensis]
MLLAIYTTLLSRLGGQTLTVGTAVAHRSHPQTYGLIGNFINMLALRTDVAGDPTFGELVSRVHRTCSAAYGHQEVPFERVVEEINPPRDTSRGAIFQTTLVMQPASAPADFAGLDIELIELGSRSVRADLELHLWDRPEFVGRLAFSTDLFDRTTAQSFVDRFVQLAETAVVEPDRRLTELPMLLPDERVRLQQWSRGEPACESFVPVHEQIAEQALLRPNAPAVVDSQGRTLTFGELAKAATALARRLVSLGVRPETRVGICLERSVDLAVAALGVLASGGAYVPLDPGYPAERLGYLAEDSAAPIVITSPELADTKLAGLPATLVWIDGDDVPAALPSTVDSGSLAYVIYTSGSTGRPKGVQIEHRSLANLAYAMRRRPGLGPDDTMTMIASLSFDASVAELFPPLAAGARVVVVDADDARVTAAGWPRSSSGTRSPSCRRWRPLGGCCRAPAESTAVAYERSAVESRLATSWPARWPSVMRHGTCTARPNRPSGRRVGR